MKKLQRHFITLLTTLFSFSFLVHSADTDCPRKVEVMAYGYKDAPPGTFGHLGTYEYQRRWIDDNKFNQVAFLKEFQGLFRSARLRLNILDKPEYSLTATFSKTTDLNSGQPMSCLTIVFAFNGGKGCYGGLSYSWIDDRYPCAYHYHKLMTWTTQAPGHDLSTHVALMSKQIKISEIENKMTGFEQIPISAEFEKEPEWCDEKGLQAQSKGDLTINIVKFKAAAPPIEGSAHEVRIVVRAQKGTIRNGDFMKEDPKAKVFTISPQGVGGSARVTVYYRPPRGEDNSDILTVLNSCDVYYTTEVPLNETTKGTVLLEAVELCNVKGYAGTINVIKSWEYKKNYKNYAITYVGNLTSTISGIFKPVPQMEGMEGQPVKIFGRGTANGTWRYNEQTFCEGDCDCEGMTYEEYGSGSYSSMNLDGIMIITNLFPTDIKVVADQLSQFGMENWYDIMIPHETVKTQSRTRMKNKEGHCEWNNSNSTTVLTECSVRFKLSDIKTLNGNVRWGSKSETTTISITDLTEAIYDQKPFDPERDGNDYTYTITWNLKAI